jgi:hypothetical protein
LPWEQEPPPQRPEGRPWAPAARSSASGAQQAEQPAEAPREQRAEPPAEAQGVQELRPLDQRKASAARRAEPTPPRVSSQAGPPQEAARVRGLPTVPADAWRPAAWRASCPGDGSSPVAPLPDSCGPAPVPWAGQERTRQAEVRPVAPEHPASEKRQAAHLRLAMRNCSAFPCARRVPPAEPRLDALPREEHRQARPCRARRWGWAVGSHRAEPEREALPRHPLSPARRASLEHQVASAERACPRRSDAPQGEPGQPRDDRARAAGSHRAASPSPPAEAAQRPEVLEAPSLEQPPGRPEALLEVAAVLPQVLQRASAQEERQAGSAEPGRRPSAPAAHLEASAPEAH